MFVFVFDRSSPDSGYTLIHDLASRLQEARPDKILAVRAIYILYIVSGALRPYIYCIWGARAIYILYLGRYAFHQDCK